VKTCSERNLRRWFQYLMETKWFKIFMINSGNKFNLYCSNKNLKLYFNNLLFTTFLSIMNLFSFFLAMITSLEELKRHYMSVLVENLNPSYFNKTIYIGSSVECWMCPSYTIIPSPPVRLAKWGIATCSRPLNLAHWLIFLTINTKLFFKFRGKKGGGKLSALTWNLHQTS
jgi:hypothetical protein